LATLGVIDHAYVRPPLLPLSADDAAAVDLALKQASLV
jgi:dihydrodipicolinate synthase/N-acetylneuraminate lyase